MPLNQEDQAITAALLALHSQRFRDLTVKVELEFVLVASYDELAERYPGANHHFDALRTVLREIADKVQIYTPTLEQDMFAIPDDGKLWEEEDWDLSVGLDYEEQQLIPDKFDSDVKNKVIAFSVEVRSRVMDLCDPDWKEEVKTVIDKITEHFDGHTSDDPFRLLINTWRSGMRVHIGKGPMSSQYFTHRTVQNFTKFVTAFERFIDEAHTVSRISEKTALEVGPTVALQRCFFNEELPASQWVAGSSNSWIFLFTILSKIDKRRAKEPEDINDYFSAFQSPGSAYGLSGPQTPMTRSEVLQTIKFRQHRGTLDVAEIVAWVHVAALIVDYCQCATYEELDNFMNPHVFKRHYSFTDLLKDICADEVLIDYYKMKLAPGRAQEERDWAIEREQSCRFGELVSAVEHEQELSSKLSEDQRLLISDTTQETYVPQ
ncbi:hypothetical protein BDY21DRAFT_365865 [Lineolata rhizophorae]|uniref:Uncharacterized protein n=1 Tax=Lineolata rhizophorae TaxID=578093 RepID=A0A6A6NSQ8_9PEZI|nr:hypothetical protein BDY21DRAFT_365865 [Lineolata rhizophorae]